jgi:peptidoglycan/LPS O-acetylase OafA/YrhL
MISTSVQPVATPVQIAYACESGRLGYRPWLDGVRGIAITAVFIHHLQHFIYQGRPLFLPLGSLGVDIFFVLSGFLITTLLLEEHASKNTINLKNFYIRRALRLLPALFVLLAFTALFALLFLPFSEAMTTARLSFIAIFYGTNWALAFGERSDLLGHLWSLAVEEQFYVIWPLALMLLLRSGLAKRRLVLLIVSLIVLVCLYRCLLVSPEVDPLRIYFGSDTRADSLLAGCLVAMLVSWQMVPRTRRTLTALKFAGGFSVLIVAAYIFNISGVPGRTLYQIGFTVFAISVGVFILQVMMTPNSRYKSILQRPTLVWIGKLSYSLYLWHFFTIGLTLRIPVSNPIRVAIAIPIALGIATSSYYLIEKPFLKLKSRYAAEHGKVAAPRLSLVSSPPVPVQ